MKRLTIAIILAAALLAGGCSKAEEPPDLQPLIIAPDAKLVSLYFDDAFLNQYEEALPILKEHGLKATFGVITDYAGTGHGLWQYMDLKHLKELADAGMDIASHTVNHPNLTANLTGEQLRHEIEDSKLALEKMGFRVTTMVYPYYEWDERTIEYVRAAGYRCARAGWSREKAYKLSTQDNKDRFHVFSWQITNQDMGTFRNYLKEAGPDSLVGLTYHFITDNGPESTSTPVSNFREQMACLAEEGYTVVLLQQLFQ